MQRSFSSTSVEYRPNPRSTTSATRSIPIRLVPPTNQDYYSSDTDSHHQTYLQRASSTSSFCSSSSTTSAGYRILPVRYSSVDRTLPKPAIVTANEHGINVRIRFSRPKSYKSHQHYHHHRQHQHSEEYERRSHKQSVREQQRYGSCPVLNDHRSSTSARAHRSNINYIETRSIVRGYSSEQLNRNTHSSTLIIRQQSLPPPSIPKLRLAQARVKHIPLDTRAMFRPVITRVIREEKEEECDILQIHLRTTEGLGFSSV